MNYIGEHLLPGQLGHLFILLSLVSSIGATVAYFLHVQAKDNLQKTGWRKLARIFFFAEVISVFAIFGILYYIISNHYFEYKYVWQHSSRSLEPKYLLSCFWEGQEGSFLLWSVWHCVLGLIVIWKEKQWEGPVMAVISFAQVLLATMLLGFTDLHIGSNPFVLMRNSGMLDNAPAFFDMTGGFRQDYLSLIKDGNDLNPLLQNYWMVIHPPVLFLGFASVLIPFGFAIGGLWTKKYGEWTKAALPWALFSAAALGTGIMMGSAWAYESLNFGGYWAWDPVENASLVPWMVMVAGIHTLVIYRHTGNALRTTYLFFILSFLLVLYSTYLTRSGDLQDTSVHAFTGEGITKWHLRAFLLAFAVPAFILFFQRYKTIPFIAKEEEASSREFWMFIGSLVLFLSSLLIISMTSIPIVNKLASLFTEKQLFTPLAVGEDAAYSYNRIQVFVAVIIGLLTGIGMYFKYRQTSGSFLKKLILPAVIGLTAGVLVVIFGDVDYREKTAGFMVAIWFAVVAAVFALVANAGYIITGLKGSLKRAGGAISHVGFAMLLVGVLISSSKKEVLSYNTSGIFMDFGSESKEKPGENLTLIKDVKTDMGKYWVTYVKDSVHEEKPLWYYHLRFDRKDGKETFVLAPNAFVNYKNQEGLMANPDSKHYWDHDIFTYITSLPDPEKNKDTSSFKTVNAQIGDTVYYSKGYAIIEDVASFRDIPNVQLSQNDSASVATLKFYARTGSLYTGRPILINKDGGAFPQPDTLTAENLIVQLQRVDGRKVELGVKESDALMQYVTLKAYIFPYINLVWGGTILMTIGFIISMFYRRQQSNLASKKLKVYRKEEKEREVEV
ncbi:cytochrome c biogenesis protein CcsA [Flavisolibacter sp. BT320]|nr:cytochrome c biogenesis protein CcsA [Flavisolibacter longurius]